MSGPCSMPSGPRREWQEMNEIVCDIHFKCDMDTDKTHDYITYREWLYRRNRLVTGKSR